MSDRSILVMVRLGAPDVQVGHLPQISEVTGSDFKHEYHYAAE